MRNKFFLIVFWSFCFSFFSCQQPDNRPSVIIITLDTTRADHLSLYGYFRKTTPFLEELAKESVVFNQAYTPITHTVPAHTSLFTAHYPSEHKVLYNGWKLKDWDKPLLAEVLRKEGYQTGAVLGSKVLQRRVNLNRGFQFYYDENWEHHLVVKRKKEVSKFSQRRAEEVVAHSQKWLSRINRKKPFFLWMHFYDPHYPFDLPPDFPAPFKLDEEYQKYLTQNYYLLQSDFERPDIHKEANTYDNELNYLDRCLEKFFQYLKAQGLLEKTLIIITADHGEGLGQHYLYGHDLYFYQEQAHIPLLVRFPDKYKAGVRIDATVSLIDIAPTVLDYLKIPDPMSPSGASFLKIISGEKQELRTCQFFERRWFEPPQKARVKKKEKPLEEKKLNPTLVNKKRMRPRGRKAGALCQGWKAIWADQEEQELYYLPNDPLELNNLRESEPKKYLELETEIKAHLEKIKFFSVKSQEVPEDVKKELRALGYVR